MQKTVYIPIDTTFDFTFECPLLVKKYDTLKLKIAIFDKGLLKNLTDQTINLVLKKADGKNIEKTIEDKTLNIASIVLDKQASSCAGKVQGEVIITDSTGQTTTNTFVFNVSNSLTEDIQIKSEDSIDTLQDMRALIAAYKNEITAIGESVQATEALNNITTYIENNLNELTSKNATASANIDALKTENDRADSNIPNLNTLNDTAEEKLQEFRLYDTTELNKRVQENTAYLNDMEQQKVDKIEGKGLSTNDYNNTEKAEVAKVKDKADTNYVNNALALKADKSEVTNVMTPKGNIVYASLPTTGNTVGDYYYCLDGDSIHGAGNYVWNGTTFYFGGTGDQGYNILKSELNKLGNELIYPTFTENMFIRKTVGDINSDSYYSASSYIDVYEGFIYDIYAKCYNDASGYAFYDVNKNYISGGGLVPSGTEMEHFSITAPNGARYIRYSTLTYGHTNSTIQATQICDSIINALESNRENSDALLIEKVDVLNSSLNSLIEDGTDTLLRYGNWVNGDNSNGTLYPNIKYRVSTDTIMSFDKDITLLVKDNFTVKVFFFVDGVYQSASGWVTKYTVPKGMGFNITIRRVTEDTTEIADMSEFVPVVTFKTTKQVYWENIITPPYWILHLDCGRKYITVDNVKLILDKMKVAGFNQIQLHFSEDSGFRLALNDMNIKDEDGNTYNLSQCLGGNENPSKWYSQSEMDTIIEYSNSLEIDVVPSFDMPGHMNWILAKFPSFNYNSSGTLDITNATAVKFAKAIVDKYSKYFVSRGCHYWNIGYDEIVGSTGFQTFYEAGNYQTVVDFANTIISVVKKNGLIPRIFNEVVYYNSDYNYMIDKDVEILSWYSPTPCAQPNQLQTFGYKIINSNSNFYWVLGKPTFQVTAEYLENANLLRGYHGTWPAHNGYGAAFCIWCDSASSLEDAGDGGNNLVSSIDPLITAFGVTIKKSIS